MSRNPLLRPTLVWLLGALAGLLPLAHAEAVTPSEQLQIHANRATSSVLQILGEGFQTVHLRRLEGDLVALESSVKAIPDAPAQLLEAHAGLVTQLRAGPTFGPNEDDIPWRYPEDLSRALRVFLDAARKLPGAGGDEMAAKVEYLGVQYLARSYMGTFEIAREQPDTYLGQDERLLLPDIDNTLAKIDTHENPQAARIKTRWNYLRSALADMNSKSNTLMSVSGRPFAPTTVDRHTRALTEQWMALH